jgi:hypothetical protein
MFVDSNVVAGSTFSNQRKTSALHGNLSYSKSSIERQIISGPEGVPDFAVDRCFNLNHQDHVLEAWTFGAEKYWVEK